MADSSRFKKLALQVDLVDLVKEFVPNLKQAGRNWSACCPFHREQHPSFTVYPDTQTWKCFGCQEQGDSLDFYRKINGLDIKEAAEAFTKRLGLESIFTQASELVNEEERQLYEINKQVAELSRAALYGNSGQEAREYLLSRGIKPKVWEQWGLGFYPPSGFRGELTDYSSAALQAAGILVNRDNRWREPFAGRIIFPMLNQQGRNVALAGRVLNNQDRPKYMNSPNNRIFEKSKFLYGLHIAIKAARLAKRLVFVEGHLDVVSAHTAGTKECVGVMGTAINDTMLAQATKIAPQLVIALDSDKSGQAATFAWARRASSLSNVFVAVITDAKDAHELLTSTPNGLEIWNKALDNATPIVDHLINTLGPNARTINEKQELAQQLWSMCEKTVGIERETYLDAIAKALNVSTTALLGTLRMAPTPPVVAPDAKKRRTGQSIPAESLRPTEQLLALALSDNRWLDNTLGFLRVDDFSGKIAQGVLSQITELHRYAIGDVRPTDIIGQEAQEWIFELLERYREVVLVLPVARDTAGEYQQLTSAIRRQRWESTCEQKRHALAQAIKESDWAMAAQLSEELQSLARVQENKEN